VQFSGVESPAVKRRFCVCCSTAIFGVCNSVRLNSCIKIRCQETDSGDCYRLRTLVFAAVNRKMWRIAVVL
jgi:hypothetical protein